MKKTKSSLEVGQTRARLVAQNTIREVKTLLHLEK
jgi:hypothetical protein